MGYRIGLDIGTNSIGWCVLELDAAGNPASIRDLGVRIFTDGRDPQKGTSLASDRRLARGARRNRDRYLLRRRDLMAALVRHGLMPADTAERKALEIMDPYELRAKGLDDALTPHELGRAIFHLSQRRGFKSNRKTESAADDESGKVKTGGARLESLMTETKARTLGEYLWFRHREHAPVRARLLGAGAKAEYDIYPQRDMAEAEFDALWAAQARFNAGLNDSARDGIKSIVFRQRPLRPQFPGKCALDPAASAEDTGGFRAPWALPLAQRFRILQELANLRIVAPDQSERCLTKDERDKLFEQLLTKAKPKFSALARAIKLGPDKRFNLESEKWDSLKGDETAAVLGGAKLMGKAWRELDLDAQSAIVERLLEEEIEGPLVAWLGANHGIDEETARKMAGARLPQGHCRLGRRAISRLVPIIADQGLDYAAAANEAGYHHSDRRPDQVLDTLPYYGEALQRHVAGTGDPGDPDEARYGRIPNPTVHIGLNQARRLVNRIIGVHGRPDAIVVELARELKLNREQKDRIRKEQADNTFANDLRREKIAEQGLADSGENRMRMRLWEELNPDNPLDRRCPYTGEVISIDRLFSDAVEIEHILAFSRTLDNSAANRTVAMRYANRAKGDRSPFEAFGKSPTIAGHRYDWDGILERTQNLRTNKQWRFGEDAMARFENEERDFLDRQLADTQYLSRIAREYLSHVCPANQVWVTPGRMTAMMRRWWGLDSILSDANQKERTDHRHHAIDAAVTAVTDRGLLQRVARAAARSETEDRSRLMSDTPEPWEGFRDDLRDKLAAVTVSHRPDHGTEGELHEATNYGLVADPDAEGGYNLVYRKPLISLNENEAGRIRDLTLRQRVLDHLAEGGDGKLEDRLRAFAETNGVHRVRLLKKEQGVIGMADRSGHVYRAVSPGDNHHIDVLALPDGSWTAWAVTVFDANRAGGSQPPWKKEHPAARRVMRLHKGDLLKLEREGSQQVMRVVRLEPSAGRVRLAGHLESGNLEQRHKDPDDPFRWTFAAWARLSEWRARKLFVDEMGRVRDPGFKQ